VHSLTAVVCGVSGLGAGALANGMIVAGALRQPFTRPGPHCRTCGTSSTYWRTSALAALARAPRGCPRCASAVRPKFPVAAFGIGALWAAAGSAWGWAWALPAFLVFFFAAVVLAAVDLESYALPRRIVLPTTAACALLLLVAALATGEWSRATSAVLGFVGARSFFWVVHMAHPRGMGFGDVRLMGLIGLMTGWMSLGNTVLAVLVGLLLGAVTGLALVVLRLRGFRQAIPFGPFLIAGAITSMLTGGPLATLLLNA